MFQKDNIWVKGLSYRFVFGTILYLNPPTTIVRVCNKHMEFLSVTFVLLRVSLGQHDTELEFVRVWSRDENAPEMTSAHRRYEEKGP